MGKQWPQDPLIGKGNGGLDVRMGMETSPTPSSPIDKKAMYAPSNIYITLIEQACRTAGSDRISTTADKPWQIYVFEDSTIVAFHFTFASLKLWNPVLEATLVLPSFQSIRNPFDFCVGKDAIIAAGIDTHETYTWVELYNSGAASWEVIGTAHRTNRRALP